MAAPNRPGRRQTSALGDRGRNSAAKFERSALWKLISHPVPELRILKVQNCTFHYCISMGAAMQAFDLNSFQLACLSLMRQQADRIPLIHRTGESGCGVDDEIQAFQLPPCRNHVRLTFVRYCHEMLQNRSLENRPPI